MAIRDLQNEYRIQYIYGILGGRYSSCCPIEEIIKGKSRKREMNNHNHVMSGYGALWSFAMPLHSYIVETLKKHIQLQLGFILFF